MLLLEQVEFLRGILVVQNPNQPHWTRRQFLHSSSVAGVGLTALRPWDAQAASAARPLARQCIFINLLGGPSQLETFDPKPDAPAEVRGPLAPIATRVPGLYFSEILPRLAARADRLTVLRTVWHDEAPIHEAGLQLLQCGRLSAGNVESPHFGATLDYLLAQHDGKSASVILPAPLGDTGVRTSRGQGSGFLGPVWEPVLDCEGESSLVGRATAADRSLYGNTQFGRACLAARHWIEHGARSVTVNMFDSLYHQTTWDAHANGSQLPTTLDDYRQSLGPLLDHVLSALLDDLEQRGLLEDTLVVAAGEFGRTPRLNLRGGRDHWPHCWSLLMAGGRVPGGRAIGVSDAWAARPEDRPIHASQVTATIFQALGVSPATEIRRPDGSSGRLVDADPLVELWS